MCYVVEIHVHDEPFQTLQHATDVHSRNTARCSSLKRRQCRCKQCVSVSVHLQFCSAIIISRLILNNLHTDALELQKLLIYHTWYTRTELNGI